jgi:hypothetical protein
MFRQYESTLDAQQLFLYSQTDAPGGLQGYLRDCFLTELN